MKLQNNGTHLKMVFKIIIRVFVYALILNICSFSGTFENAQFNILDDGVNDSNLIYKNGLLFATKDYRMVKLFGDTLHGFSKNTLLPQITNQEHDTVTYYYSDTLNNIIYSRKNLILENRVAALNSWTKFCDADVSSKSYLHANSGTDGDLISFIKNGSNNTRYLRVNNSKTFLDIDSTRTTDWMFSSQCHMEGDTFLVAYSYDMTKMMISKVYSNGTTIKVISSKQIATGIATSGNAIMNCSVAFDKQNTILLIWSKGTPTGDKFINYSLIDRTFNIGKIDSFSTKVCDSSFFYYDDARAAAYDQKKFVIAYWNSTGLYISKIIDNLLPVTDLVATGRRNFCTISASDKYLLLTSYCDLNGDGVRGIEALRYPIVNGSPGVPDTIVISNPNHSVAILDECSSAINSFIDTAGTCGVTWRNADSIQSSIFAKRGVKYSKGFWNSPVESLNVGFQDSIQYYPVNVSISSLDSWYLEDSLRYGCSINECKNAPWISLSNSTILNLNKTTCKYFQYRITINRKSTTTADSIVTPTLTKVSIPYNIQPVLNSIDSIYINNTKYNSAIGFSESLHVYSRSDTAKLFVKIRDQDTNDQISYRHSSTGSSSVTNHLSDYNYSAKYVVIPFLKDTAVNCIMYAWDSKGWNATPKNVNILTRNSIPVINLKALPSGAIDTLRITKDTSLLLQENDSISFSYSVTDTNDFKTAKEYIGRKIGTVSTYMDSLLSPAIKIYKLRADTVRAVDSVRMIFTAIDPDTVVNKKVSIAINHAPKLPSITVNGKNTVNGDTVSVKVGVLTDISVNVKDTDVVFWDSISCSISTKTFSDSLITSKIPIQYTYRPALADSQIVIKVHDKSGKRDSILVYVKCAWLATDSILNPAFWNAKKKLVDSVYLIDGSTDLDSVNVPFENTGNDSMHIIGCQIKGEHNKWLSVVIGKDTIISGSSTTLKFILLNPGEIFDVKALFSAKWLTGDSVVSDTIVFFTDEPSHAAVIIPVTFEYNDLPQIVDIKPYFINDRPYWRLLKVKAFNENQFPAHASMEILFSEPIDSASVIAGMTVYSVFDSLRAGKKSPIAMQYSWSQNYTKLTLSANYSHASEWFGYKPPQGLFIPTDSIGLTLTNKIKDQAKTPHGPNELDIHYDKKKYSYSDTTVRFRVDSSTFTITKISPIPGDSAIESQNPKIVLTFSAPVYAASVDTSKKLNKTLIVTSKYNKNKQLEFDSIIVKDNNVTFRLAKKLFYYDSLNCLYKSISVRNMAGFSIDNNKNGIPAADYDSISTEDDISWKYRIKGIKVVSVSPEDKSLVNNISPPIVITFSAPVLSGTFDTDTSFNNRSIKVNSLYSSVSSKFSSIIISKDSLQVTIQPASKFFSDDSVNCIFAGFSNNFNYDSTKNLPMNQTSTFSNNKWYFVLGNTGFYTYPNPYKPGRDPRHCSENGPCGIWFKNLHVLKRGITDVNIKIYDINRNIVFETQKSCGPIHFETGNIKAVPQWLWNTKNSKNELVASGLYIYVIYDLAGHVLIKNKLIIVR